MKIIGITGGIGAGKSQVLEYLASKKDTYIVVADQVAHQVKNPGTECYHMLISLLGSNILDKDNTIDKNKLSEIIFKNPSLLNKVNQIIHPAVKQEILKQIEKKKSQKNVEFFFIEAALLIEDGYTQIVDELWYIYANETIRKERLKVSRNYSEEKINSIFNNQLSDAEYRKHCNTVIDNSSDLDSTYRQIDRKLEDTVAELKKYPGQLVFGLDIGTRSIVGTVGYKDGEKFYVVAQYMKEHETRSMMDGQIHDIDEVGKTICQVKEGLESKIGRRLTEVCIAAAGRVLETVNAHVDLPFDTEKKITNEDIYNLESLGVEQAYEAFLKENKNGIKFYCVGFTVMKYYLNDYTISKLINHKAKKISADIIATFLPDDVIDGLYRAVEIAGLEVVNLTLEPIAAMQVAIHERYRMLNIALVDVGAGTSDICITKDGSIVSYGMIPCAGDFLTETIAKHCLVDFQTAESIKTKATQMEVITFQDIMGLPQKITSKDVEEILDPFVDVMTEQVADEIIRLNGGKPVSAVFIVGGGGKFLGYSDKLAKNLGIQKERAALRGEEVMENIIFLEKSLEINSLMITPIGICLNFYEQTNNFIYVVFNDQRVKLYDNSKLTIVDAAMQASYPNENLFPKRGKSIEYMLDGKKKIMRGEMGEAAIILLNNEPADLHKSIKANDIIEIRESTAGDDAKLEIRNLPEYKSSIGVIVNDKKVMLPKFVSVNGSLESSYYSIGNGDEILLLNYYTVKQLAEFMDVTIDSKMNIYVNNQLGDQNTIVYENFSVQFTLETLFFKEHENFMTTFEEVKAPNKTVESPVSDTVVMVNGNAVHLFGKSQYLFVEIFEKIDFDLTKPKGKGIVTKVNGTDAQYLEPIHNGDVIEVFWKE